MYRHGDLLIVAADVPAGAVPQPDWDGVLARGEVTGHAHRMVSTSGATLLRDVGDMHLVLGAPGVLTHEDHGDIRLAPGAYRVIRQREYTPEAIRDVRD